MLRRASAAVLPAACLLLVAGCLLQILAGYSHPDLPAHAWGTDDAYISYRYALNLAEGNGLVFNPGERVEGFSNLLYVLLLAPAAALAGPDPLYAVSSGLNILCAVAALVLLVRFARDRIGDFGASGLAVLFALCPFIWLAVASGLETPLVLLLQIITWILVERTLVEERDPIGPLCAVATISVLARADGFLTPLLAAAYLGLRGRRRAAAGVALVTLATVGALVAFRLAYYGWPLPNTYYAKVGVPLAVRAASGARELVSVGAFTGLLFYILVIVAVLVRGLSRRRLSALPFPAIFAAGWMAYYIYVGGDVFHERFLLFVFPMGAFLVIEQLQAVLRPRLLSAVIGLLLILQLAHIAMDPRFAYSANKYDCWVTLGRYLGRAHPGAVVAVDGAGKIPYFSNLRSIDMLGLTDVHIGHGRMAKKDFFWVGHAKSDPAYVLSRRPDLITKWIPETHREYLGGAPKPEALAAAGYRLIYLVNDDEWSKQPNIVDVRASRPNEILQWLNKGYRLGVYGRSRR